MPHPIDHALLVVEELRSARQQALEYRIASANYLLDGARISTAPHVQARKFAIAARIARGVAATLANRRTLEALGPAQHERLAAQVATLIARVGPADVN